MIFAYLLLMVAVLAGVFIVGWYLIAPPIEWLCQKIFDLAAKGNEYYILTRELKAGQAQDQAT